MKKEKINLRTKDDGGNDGVEPKRESEEGSCFFKDRGYVLVLMPYVYLTHFVEF
jgi:hypothetical protein